MSRSWSWSWSWSGSMRLAGLLSMALRLRFIGPAPLEPWLRMAAAKSASMARTGAPHGREGERGAGEDGGGWGGGRPQSRASGFPGSRGGTGRRQIGCWARQIGRREVRSRGVDASARELKVKKPIYGRRACRAHASHGPPHSARAGLVTRAGEAQTRSGQNCEWQGWPLLLLIGFPCVLSARARIHSAFFCPGRDSTCVGWGERGPWLSLESSHQHTNLSGFLGSCVLSCCCIALASHFHPHVHCCFCCSSLMQSMALSCLPRPTLPPLQWPCKPTATSLAGGKTERGKGGNRPSPASQLTRGVVGRLRVDPDIALGRLIRDPPRLAAYQSGLSLHRLAVTSGHHPSLSHSSLHPSLSLTPFLALGPGVAAIPATVQLPRWCCPGPFASTSIHERVLAADAEPYRSQCTLPRRHQSKVTPKAAYRCGWATSPIAPPPPLSLSRRPNACRHREPWSAARDGVSASPSILPFVLPSRDPGELPGFGEGGGGQGLC